MKYTSFATLAAAFAVVMLAGTAAPLATAKSDVNQQATAVQSKVANAVGATQLYADAGVLNSSRTVRFDAQPVGTEAAQTSVIAGDHDPLNIAALVLAGFAVMGSLAFRRSPNK
ncbi:hypothetical protein BH09PSE5_BH09PSE5_24470 [soil metagenome]